jgi:hypothetical protein
MLIMTKDKKPDETMSLLFPRQWNSIKPAPGIDFTVIYQRLQGLPILLPI